ncbi:MAG: flagellar basal body P-ring formation chaperone FlgA [Acidobacteriota bacterium]
MRCSPKSTTWFADATRLVVGLALLLVGAAVGATEDVADPLVAAAIIEAVETRVGTGFDVQVESLTARLAKRGVAVAAVPAPGARLGQPARFTLVTAAPASGRPARVGDAVATVRVTGAMVRAAVPIARGQAIDRRLFVVQAGDAGRAPIAALPTPAQLIGAEAARDIRAGELLAPPAIRPAPLVESGQLVVTVATIGAVGVEGRAVASQRGVLGQTIRLVNPDTRRLLRGRVVGAGRVEVMP